MKFREKNDEGLELHLSLVERIFLHTALQVYLSHVAGKTTGEIPTMLWEAINVISPTGFGTRGGLHE